jgi:hypothetical protein
MSTSHQDTPTTTTPAQPASQGRPSPRTEVGLLDAALTVLNARLPPDRGAVPAPSGLMRVLAGARQDRGPDFPAEFERGRPTTTHLHLIAPGPAASPDPVAEASPPARPGPAADRVEAAPPASPPVAAPQASAATTQETVGHLHENTRLFLAALERRDAALLGLVEKIVETRRTDASPAPAGALEQTNSRLLSLLEHLIDPRPEPGRQTSPKDRLP